MASCIQTGTPSDTPPLDLPAKAPPFCALPLLIRPSKWHLMASTPEVEVLPEPAGSVGCLRCAVETSASASIDTAYQEMFDSPHNDVPSSRSSVTRSAHGDALTSELHHRLNQTTAFLQTLGVTDHRGRRGRLTGNDVRKRNDWWTDDEPADVLRCAGWRGDCGVCARACMFDHRADPWHRYHVLV